MTYRIAIGPSSFAEKEKQPLEMLKSAGVEIVANPFSRRLTEEETISHLKGVDGLIAGLEPLNKHVLLSAPQLKAIARVGIGMDNVDLKTTAELGIKVSNTPDAPAAAVAELTTSAADRAAEEAQRPGRPPIGPLKKLRRSNDPRSGR